MRLQGKVAVVTGGGMGMGRSACLLLAREGAKVAVTDVSENDAMQTVEDIRRTGGTAEHWHLDVTRVIEVKNTFAEIVAEFETIDVLVNNAGIAGVNKPRHEITEEERDQLMAVNVKVNSGHATST
jgi:NAD(P)-dependent dehydrogenase (short-subunit alcohol dehydrogenase family)